MVENSNLPGGIGTPKGPPQLGAVPHPPEDNARKRFRLEQERRRAEKKPKEPTDGEGDVGTVARDHWDGERQGEDGPKEGGSEAEGTRKPRGGTSTQEGGLDVVA
jgi:hypothetical protein